MARATSRGRLGPQMTRGELVGGFLYWPLFVLGVPMLLGWLFDLLAIPVSEARLNLCYFLLNFLVVALVFRKFLIASLGAISGRFWAFVQSVILSFVFYYALSWLCMTVLHLLGAAVNNPNDQSVLAMADGDFRLILFCTVFLAPLVEETLVRGLIFGNLHIKSRIAAYAVSTLVFCGLHVWQYVPATGWQTALLAALQYIPAGVALGWAYEKAETIWAPIVVHCLINAVTMGIVGSAF